MNGLDLFSGIGGLELALRPWVRTVAYCEVDRYCQGVLLSRMRSGDISEAPIWDDVRTLKSELLPKIDIIYGGFPCQDLSSAGRGAGLAGERSGLYFEIERLIREAKPAFVFLENVPAIRTRGLGRVVWGLSELGYDLRWTVVSAQEVGAPHIRKRWFLLAYSSSKRQRQDECLSRQGRQEMVDHDWGRENLVDAGRERSQRPSLTETTWKALTEYRSAGERDWPSWLPKPALPRGDHGLSERVDRTRGLGNAVVPLQAREAFKRLAGIGDT